ncbi:MAG TPA: hypothetical protein VFC78_10375 [Tepidisphaeraceae bacterium]|nr:hypothetical protein [Tepidisphaeraceae bacterium]
MTFQRLEAVVERKPFVPFNLHLAEGDVITVKSPEFIWLHPSKRVVFVATGEEEDSDDRIIDLLLVSQISTGNGFHPSVQMGGKSE